VSIRRNTADRIVSLDKADASLRLPVLPFRHAAGRFLPGWPSSSNPRRHVQGGSN